MFSIVCINYNQPIQLNILIGSVIQIQFDRKNFELIIVDDGSSPPLPITIKIPESITFKHIYLDRNDKSCRSRARNLGAAQATGKYLVFLDGDCLVKPDFLERYKNYFAIQRNRKVVIGSLAHIKPLEYKLIQNLESYDKLLELVNSNDLRFDITKKTNSKFCDMNANWVLFLSGNFSIELEYFNFLNGFDERFKGWGSEDTELAYRITKHGEKFDLLNNPAFHLILIEPMKSPRLNMKHRYLEWIRNIQTFYEIHKDPKILLLTLQEQIIFDCFCMGYGWNDVEYEKAFLKIHSRTKFIENIINQ